MVAAKAEIQSKMKEPFFFFASKLIWGTHDRGNTVIDRKKRKEKTSF